MDWQDPEISKAIRAALAPVPELLDRLNLWARAGPEPGSAADADGKRPLGELPMIYAIQRLSVAGDHLLAWCALHHANTQPVYAHQTLLRTALETAATARWVLAPKSAAGRITRAATVQDSDFAERAKLEKSLGKTEADFSGEGHSGAYRLAQHRARLVVANLVIERVTKTEMVRQFAGRKPMRSDALYRVLSAFGHGEGLSAWMSDRGEPIETRLPRTGAQSVSSHDPTTQGITELAMLCLTLGVGELTAYAT